MKKKVLGFFGITLATLTLAACGNNNKNNNSGDTDNYKISIACPSGAPLMAISGAVEAENIGHELTLIEDTSTIPSIFQAAQNKEDIIVAPVNVGTKLYNAGNSAYKLAAVVTWGNTYFASQKAGFTLNDINGNDITLFGETSINAGIAKYVLAKKSIVPSNYLYPNPDEVKGANQLLIQNATAMVMTADPMLTVAKSKKTITSYSISDLYKEITNHDYPQAAIFVNPDTYEEHKGKFDEFFGAVKETCEKAATNPSEVAEKSIELGIEQTKEILTAAIPGCNLKYVKASDAKLDLAFAATEEGLKQYFGNKAPVDSFYLF